MCDIPSPIDVIEDTIPFTPENTFSVYSSSYSVTPLHSSTICESISDPRSVHIPANAATEESAPSRFQAFGTMVSKAFFSGKWKGTDSTQVIESNKSSTSQTENRSAQKRDPCSDIDAACPVSSKLRLHQGQSFCSTDGSKPGKSRLPLLKKHATEDKLGETRRSLTREANSSRSSMGCGPATQETNVKDVEHRIVTQKPCISGMMDKVSVPRYSTGLTDHPYINSNAVPVTNPLPAKSHTSGGQSEPVPENAAVTVAVRVRPQNDREMAGGHKCVLSVTGQTVTVYHPQSNQRLVFQYDFCFSFAQPGDSAPCSQEEVYRQVAQPLLTRVFQGYNTCLFAYGQTGSGKSYTMMGYNTHIGIIPRFCKELFYNINVSCQEGVNYHVEMSYFEIYNEKIHDLLSSPRDAGHKIALKVREHPTYGPYVDGLSTYVVASFTDVQTWLELGNKQRATAATGMNDKSSRSHSVFTLSVTQTRRECFEGEIHDHTRTSRVNLIDLAGSERCSSAQTSGIRLKEGASINKSLLTLGKVISALAEMSDVHKRSFIPYRESLLTWLLRESLGGNSKTAMIATVSPASMNLEESLSTLRYASQARNIINVARVNEDSNAALIRELKSEIDKLRAAQQCVQGVDQSVYEASLQEICSLRERLSVQERQLTETQKSWEEKLKLAKHQKFEEAKELQKAGVCFKVDNRLPSLVNLNEDPQLSEVLLYLIKEGQTKVGKQHPGSDHEIQLAGVLIANDHCTINNEYGQVTLIPMPGAVTFVNGNLAQESVVLNHGDRVILGGNHYFRFNNPMEVQSNRRTLCLGSAGQERLRDFEFAKNELIDAQKQRIENEIGDAKLQAQTEMMQELQTAKALAQLELMEQKKLYENHIKQLEKELEEEQTRRNSFKRNQKDDVFCSRSNLPPSRSYTQMGVKQNTLVKALEEEKDTITKQVEKIQYRVKSRSSEKQEQWTALQLSISLQEANAISKSLSKQTVFSRYDPPVLNGEEKAVYIKVSNTNLGISTMWSLEKFEEKLEGMRELYHGLLDSSGDDLFYDPADTWEGELKQPSPKRKQGRTSLSRQTSGLLIGKVHTDTFVPRTTFSSVCKQLVTSETEILGKDNQSPGLVLQMLIGLHDILTSSNDVIQVYEQFDLDDVSIQRHLITVSSAFNHLGFSVRLIDDLLGAPDTQAAHPKQHLVSEVKKLGGSLAFLLHRCECDITSMLKNSKEQINQSVSVIAGLLGQFSITRQPNISQSSDEKCGLEQAEFISSSIKENFLRGSESSLSEHIDFLVGEVQCLESLYQKAWLESHKLAEDLRKCLLPLGRALEGYLNKCNQFWMQFQAMKCQKQVFTKDLSLHYFYSRIAHHLKNFLTCWKEVTATSIRYMTDGVTDFWTIKQDLEGLLKSASHSAKEFSSLCNEIAVHQEDFGLSPVMKDIEAAVPKLHYSAGDLLRLIKVLGGVNCFKSGMLLSANNRQLSGGPRADLGIHMWGSIREPVRVTIAKWNYEALLRENSSERKRTL